MLKNEIRWEGAHSHETQPVTQLSILESFPGPLPLKMSLGKSGQFGGQIKDRDMTVSSLYNELTQT
jgi:hypothetical protein